MKLETYTQKNAHSSDIPLQKNDSKCYSPDQKNVTTDMIFDDLASCCSPKIEIKLEELYRQLDRVDYRSRQRNGPIKSPRSDRESNIASQPDGPVENKKKPSQIKTEMKSLQTNFLASW